MKYTVFVSVVMLLGSAQWPTVSSVPVGLTDPPIILEDDLVPQELSFPSNGNGGVRYQGDMILTHEQWRSLLQRKAAADESFRWPKNATTGMVDIDYRYNDNIISKPGMQKGIVAWEAATCVRFHEIPSAVARPHLIFKTHASNCDAVLGYAGNDNGQDINMAPDCFEDDTSAPHELGHALGLYHEQSRSDRDQFITVQLANIEPGGVGAYQKAITNNYGVPYDYTSAMHYPPTSFASGDLMTMLTTDPLAMPLITARDRKLSFMDKKIVNLMYNCTGTWLTKCKRTTDPCKNQGYTNSNCACECPAGTSGANCETLNLPYTDALLQAKYPGFQRFTTEVTVTSPGYPTPVTKDSTRTQSIQAPECHIVKLTVNVFDLDAKVNEACSNSILEIRSDNFLYKAGTEYCGSDIIAPKTLESTGRFMILTYTTKADNTKKGYSATVKFARVTGCTSPGKIINNGILPLTPSTSTGLCRLVASTNPAVYVYSSPNYPSNYGTGQGCTMWFNTTEPRYLKVTPKIVQLGLFDSVGLFHAYQTTTNLNSGTVGKAITLPTSSSRLTFQDSFLSPTGKFQIDVEVVNSDCHQLIRLDAGTTGGPLSIPAKYPSGTICEWWLRAPAGRKVQVTFSAFSIGDSTCRNDYVFIDLTGDTRYATRSTRYCGGTANSPGKVVSTANALNILVNGQQGNFQGLTATYRLV